MQGRRMRVTHFVFGVLAGATCVAFYLLFYLLDKKFFFHPAVFWSSWLPFLAFMALSAIRERRRTEGEYTWQHALRACFTVFVIGSAIFHSFYYLFFNFGDPGLAEIQQEVILENLERFRDALGPSAAGQLERGALEEPLKYGPGTALQSFARGIIGGFIVSLGMAFALKKE